MTRIILLALLFISHHISIAQDINARIEVSAPQVLNINNRTVQVLQKAITDFINNRSWSTNTLRPEERINCSFNIILTNYDGINKYTATAQINSSRPVFGTSYNAAILSFKDKYFNFSYTEGDQLDFSDTQYLNNLSALLAFYAYTIVGMDMDSFKLNGGNNSYNKARNIINYAQSQQNDGWRAMDAIDNRYWLLNNLLDRTYEPYRVFYYQYHRHGLDNMSENETDTKQKLAALFEQLKSVNRSTTGNVLTNALFTAKSSEFAGIFANMPGNESTKMYNLLIELDPSNAAKYEKLKK